MIGPGRSARIAVPGTGPAVRGSPLGDDPRFQTLIEKMAFPTWPGRVPISDCAAQGVKGQRISGSTPSESLCPVATWAWKPFSRTIR
jgi:hypothetical protein